MTGLWHWFLCLVGEHDWTSQAQQDAPVDREKMKADPVAYFFERTFMYCSRCEEPWSGNP